MPHATSIVLPMAVCAAVIRKNGKILLTKRPADKQQGGFWEFPGGKIDPGESPHTTLKRELAEELGIEISVGEVLETVHYHYQWGAVLIFAYLCFWQAGSIQHLEVADHVWATTEELQQYKILPADQPILDRISQLSTEKVI